MKLPQENLDPVHTIVASKGNEHLTYRECWATRLATAPPRAQNNEPKQEALQNPIQGEAETGDRGLHEGRTLS